MPGSEALYAHAQYNTQPVGIEGPRHLLFNAWCNEFPPRVVLLLDDLSVEGVATPHLLYTLHSAIYFTGRLGKIYWFTTP